MKNLSLTNKIFKILETGIYGIHNKKLARIYSIAGKKLSKKQLKKLLEKGIILYFYNIKKTIALFLLSTIGSILFDKYMILIIGIEYITTGIIRKYAGGIHLNTIPCTIWGFITYFSGYLYCVNINSNFYFDFYVFIFCIIIMLIYSPHNIYGLNIKKENYILRKIITLIIIIILFILSHIINFTKINNLATWVIFIQSLHVTPIFFKILNVKDSNYMYKKN